MASEEMARTRSVYVVISWRMERAMDRARAHQTRERYRWQLAPGAGPYELAEARARVRELSDPLEVRATAYALVSPFDAIERELVMVESIEGGRAARLALAWLDRRAAK